MSTELAFSECIILDGLFSAVFLVENWHFLSTEILFLSTKFRVLDFLSVEFQFSEHGMILEGLLCITMYILTSLMKRVLLALD